MLLLELDGHSRKPKFRQIVEQIRRRVEAHSLRPGEKLPSTRRMAERLCLHRSTVALAYQELWALGFVDLRPGARAVVRDRRQVTMAASRGKKRMIDWPSAASPASREVWNACRLLDLQAPRHALATLINFSSLDMDHRLFPLENFRSSLSRTMHGGAGRAAAGQRLAEPAGGQRRAGGAGFRLFSIAHGRRPPAPVDFDAERGGDRGRMPAAGNGTG